MHKKKLNVIVFMPLCKIIKIKLNRKKKMQIVFSF